MVGGLTPRTVEVVVAEPRGGTVDNGGRTMVVDDLEGAAFLTGTLIVLLFSVRLQPAIVSVTAMNVMRRFVIATHRTSPLRSRMSRYNGHIRCLQQRTVTDYS